MNRVPLRFPLQSMEVETWHVQLLRGYCSVYGIEPALAAGYQIRTDFRRLTGFENLLEALMHKASYQVELSERLLPSC